MVFYTMKRGTGNTNIFKILKPASQGGRENLALERVSTKKYLHIYVEYRAVSGVFQNIDPPLPSPPSDVSSPRTKCGGYTLAGW